MNEKSKRIQAYRQLKERRIKHLVRQYTFGREQLVNPEMVERAVKAAYEAGYRDGAKAHEALSIAP